MVVPLLIMTESSAEAGSFIDLFYSIVYRIGDLMGKTSVGRIITAMGDNFLGLFGVELTRYTIPDYWGALTGTLSKPISWSVSIPGKNQPFMCQIFEPRMMRNSTSLPWVFDDQTKNYLDTCGRKATELLARATENF